ncbi:hypothetical protein COU77_03550 [Candidatus Peregrinibacteria bacterium CG10_big_fil_rev_8_21_14_0_10_49_16]|nr:MAG: hypothetical protein COU77_03550 [Candidatus Peregrinibacteria bacterium CG10_big_fil_rev_8_21_14_0_10_49_16]
MDPKELLREAEKLSDQLQKTRLAVRLGKEKNTAKCRDLQKKHARIHSVLREKELETTLSSSSI